ncbi:MAG TPA: hypothetical protein VGI81_05025 [Tepidisphaeraceae bacterium]|jgi:hypothetical protein
MRLSRTDALTLIRESLATLPSELDARADFFVQWRVRTIHNLELIFPDHPEIVRQFKETEFSPRRLTNKESRDEQLKLDAFLSGCVAARAQLEELVRQLLASVDAMPAPVVTPEEPQPAAASPVAPAAGPEALPEPDGEQAPPLHEEAPVVETIVVEANPGPLPVESIATESPVIQGARMNAHELCAPVRSSLSRVLGAWERGDRDAALVLSAQLLAELTLLSRDDHFKNAFEGVVTQFVDVKGVAGGLDSLHAAAPLCVWSMVAAMNEVMKAAS